MSENNVSEKNATDKKRRRTLNIANAFALMLAIMVFFSLYSLIVDAMTDSSAYEVRFENDETFATQGKLYRLYVAGEEYCSIDYNKYSLTDDNGNTDYKYCTLIEDASRLTYTVILCAMLYVVIVIAKKSVDSTPFTKENINRVKLISLLQLLLAVLPGMVRLIMSFIRFDYYSSTFDITSWYLFAISAVIAMIAFIFQKGLDLQEDVNSFI
ncbi:MAG: DUF2975 domain-containing protein [Lachnospiraceae bacterium]|nr:DUF2975 domain-containing protein [Lachnospiraceae bacterium]